ncbi:uncharacterized protein L969DRAFT_15057 [Mixia osmundae IAM 14324]|uniref:Nucleoside 2-deoxyribosyltransferase n=1 Tax=Mixia osmundae (strain CBS 9802 / IAM 14324 / JCM 22182 / KY 12970) TaxID=764103 RepID=G7DTF7_MIXOS|nr:uncharacterized protein L969DRAFT_15057 [Mixia osmundae IAM 14324]KEI42858.1 hypothetical protein L969DRAFT_15057 [Mixia osmundae IAM 14324]GAA93804.1 hypothetical protein E5Q_00450 [Mixia osmundae IAM 14324]
MKAALKVYTAGPGVFLSDAIGEARRARTLCAQHGLQAMTPIDPELAAGPTPPSAQDIYVGNVALLNASDVMVADITPFRGPNMDPGTAWEIGYGIALGMPVFLYSEQAQTTLKDRTPDSGKWTVVEDFGATENLMIARAGMPVFASLEEAAQHVGQLAARGELIARSH